MRGAVVDVHVTFVFLHLVSSVEYTDWLRRLLLELLPLCSELHIHVCLCHGASSEMFVPAEYHLIVLMWLTDLGDAAVETSDV